MARSRFLCLDCGLDTGQALEHYMLLDAVWALAGLGRESMLCVGCVEARLGCRLERSDFAPVKTNHPKVIQMSSCLLERIGSDGPPRPDHP
jgi:hypothetical protein